MSARYQLRVFVSSTFRDMHAEREQLVKHTFPQVHRLCEARGVVSAEVDLRWGIPQERVDEPAVLAACLQEIERCRPYFIGLLGERYGTVATLSDDLLTSQPWLAGQPDRSVTELEILHGVLNDPAAAERALFYFRDPAYIDRLPAGTNPADFRSENADAAARLASLKERIRRSGARVREDYCNVEQLGGWVEADLHELIDRDFPPDAHHDPVAGAHVQFAARRRRLWVGRQAELRRLDEILDGSPAALVTGAPGVGLSALLANWAAGWRQSNPATLVLEHYIGAHPGAASLDGCCRQLCLGLAAARGLPRPEVKVERDWPDLFVELLARAGAESPVLLVIDGADGLKGRGESAGAEWLPPELPPGVRMVASAGEGAVRAVAHRGYPVLHLVELATSERGELVQRYLAVSGKELSQERLQRIVAAPATGKPFYLTLLLEELRQHGEHSTLGDRLQGLLAAPDVLHLCGEVFRRCERDYDSAVPNFTARALGLLSVARTGLSDVEMCELLGGNERMPQRPWSELQLALEAMLVSHDGVISFAQDEPARIAKQLYADTPGRRLALSRQLADFFAARPDTPRTALELPWHLRQLEAWDELSSWLGRAGAFRMAWQLAPEEVCAAWEAVEEHSPRRAATACAAFPAELWPPAMNLLRQLGHWSDALTLARRAAELAHAEGDAARQLETLLTVGEIEAVAGSPYAADELFAQAEERAAATQQAHELLRALRGRAQALDRQAESADHMTRVELRRRGREIRDRALQVSDGAQDSQLRTEALVLWLENLYGHGRVTRDMVEIGGAFGRALMGAGRPSDPKGPAAARRFDAAFGHFSRTLDGRLQRLETEAITRLRHTRHRALALRADVAIATMEGDRAKTLAALEALRQHATARDDLDLLARVYEGFAAQHPGAEKLAWMERQADLLARSGRRADLVRNWMTQGNMLWRELGRPAEGLVLLRRAARERRALPSGRERRRLLIHRFLLEDRFRLPAVWLGGAVWILAIWQFCLWVAGWFGRLPLFGLIAYLFAGAFGMPAVIALLAESSAARKALLRKWTGRRASAKGATPPSRAEELAAAKLEPPRAPERAGPPHAAASSVDGAHPSKALPANTPVEVVPARKAMAGAADADDLRLPKALTAPFAGAASLGRSAVRTTRIAKRLGLNRFPARMAWFALAVPTGSALTLLYWNTTGCSSCLLLPLGLAGQVLVVGAVLGLLSPAMAPLLVRRTGRYASSGGSRIGFACLLALIRLKRRVLRHRPRRLAARRPAPRERSRADPAERSAEGNASVPSEDDLLEQARALSALGDAKKALGALDELTARLKTSTRADAKSKLLACMKAQLSLLPGAGETPRALSLARELDAMATEQGATGVRVVALAVQAAALHDRGDLAGALELHRQVEALCRELDDVKHLLLSILDQAEICTQQGNRAEALALYRRAETICRGTGDQKGLRSALGNQALLLRAEGDFAASLASHQQEEALCRELGDDKSLAASFNNQGLVYRKLGREAQALQLFRQSERLHDQAGNRRGMLTPLSNQASVLEAQGNLAGALDLYRRKEVICRELGDDRGASQARKSQERVLLDLDRGSQSPGEA